MGLLSRRLRTALYIDFENIKLDATTVANAIHWLEDGGFETQPLARRIVQKRIYWNAQSDKLRKPFEDLGFEVILIEKYGGLHNGADIRIALDMAEAAMQRRPRLDEFILVSKDSDFVPLIQRLGEKDKRTVVLANEQHPAAHTAYSYHADAIFTKHDWDKAVQTYKRPTKRWFWQRPAKTKTVAVKAVVAPETKAAAVAMTERVLPVAAPAPEAPVSASGLPPPQAIDAFVKVAMRNPGKATGRTPILKQLKSIKGFSNIGPKRYFGFKSYEDLARAVAQADARLTLKPESGGGFTVVYRPRVEPLPAAEPAKPEATSPAIDAATPAPQPAPASA